MQVKRYTGETIQDAIFKVKADLGPEAVIIDRRKFKVGGFLGFFAKTKVEILAAVEHKTAADKPEEINPIKEFISEVKNEKNSAVEKGSRVNLRNEGSAADLDDYKRAESFFETMQKASYKKAAQKTAKNRNDNKKEIFVEEKQNKKNKNDAKNNLAEKIKKLKNSQNSISAADNNIYNYLLAQGVEARFVTKFIKKLEENLEADADLKEKLPEFCRGYFNFKAGIELDEEQKIVSFIGPTGVGKTTTMAKVAAQFSMEENKKVALLTADTYRIAAVEQLQTYSDILDLPFAVSYSGDRLKNLIDKRFSDCDLILIDTPGSSWKDEAQLSRLKSYTESELIDECHLVISMNTKSSDLKRIINRFGIFNPDHMLLTKLDETETYGDLINLKENYGLPYSYLSFGQDVPEDIETAGADNIRKYLFGDYYA